MIEGFVEKLASRKITPREGDYIQDEVLYCGRCKTPRECAVELFGDIRKVACMCRCETEAYERSEAEAKARDVANRIHRLRTAGLTDKSYLQWTFESDDGRTPQMDKARKYCEKWDEFYQKNIGLLLWGNVGTGKTFFAACVANALIQRGIPVMMTNFIKLSNALQKGFGDDKNAYIKSLDNYRLLIIDDLGAERGSDFMQETAYNIIDSRYRNGQPMIVTTNLTLDEIKSPADMRYSRIYDRVIEMTAPVKFDGPARRKEIGQEKKKAAAELLLGD